MAVLMAFVAVSCEEEAVHSHSYDAKTHICSCGAVDGDKYIAIVDGVAVETIELAGAKEVELLDAYIGETALELSDITIGVYTADGVSRGALELNAVVKSSEVTLKSISSKSITVDNDFVGTFTFEGGVLEETAKGKEAFLIDSNHKQAAYVFKGMEVKTGTQKGIKIQSAKSIAIENCIFDGSGLDAATEGEEAQTRSLSAIDITIEGANNTDKVKISITGCTFRNINQAKEYPYDTAGAIKIKSQIVNMPIEDVTITGNSFEDCIRDVVIGKANVGISNYHERTGSSSEWKIEGNHSTNNEKNVKLIPVLVYKEQENSDKGNVSECIGVIRGGCSVYDIATATCYKKS